MKLHSKYLALLDHAKREGIADVDSLHLCFEVLSLADAIDRDCADRLAPYGLSEGKFVVFVLLKDATDGLSPFEIAEQAGVTRATVTGLLDGLERQGYITRRGMKDDGRRLVVRLTPRGKDVGNKLSVAHTEWIASLFSRLSPAQRRSFRLAIQDIGSATSAKKRTAS